MSDRLVVALDAMGGDRAPDMVVKGASIALQRFPQVSFLLYGDEAIDWKRIETHWTDLQRTAIPNREVRLSPVTLLRRRGNCRASAIAPPFITPMRR